MGLLPDSKLTGTNSVDECKILFALPHQLQRSLCKKAPGKGIKGVEHVPALPSSSATQWAQAHFSARLSCISAPSTLASYLPWNTFTSISAFRQVRCQTGVFFHSSFSDLAILIHKWLVPERQCQSLPYHAWHHWPRKHYSYKAHVRNNWE